MKPLSKRYNQNRRCGCSKRITDGNKSGLCKQCLMRSINANEDLVARRLETTRRNLREDSATYAKKCAILAKNRDKAFARPEVMAMLRENATRLASYQTPETEAKRIAALVEANKRRRHKWLPEEWRETYFRMMRNWGFKAPEAKRIIMEQMRAERERINVARQRARASLSPFERQQRDLENGAQIVANDQRPSLANPGYYEERKTG